MLTQEDASATDGLRSLLTPEQQASVDGAPTRFDNDGIAARGINKETA